MREYKKLKNYETQFVVEIYIPHENKKDIRYGVILSRGHNKEEGAANAKKELVKKYGMAATFHFSKFSTKEI